MVAQQMTFTELSMDELDDPVALLLNSFFTPSDASQAAGHAYLDRLNRREADRDTPVSMTAAAAQLGAIREWGEIPTTDRYAMLSTIRQPTLIVHGTKDIVVDAVNATVLEEELCDATLLMLPDASHAVQSNMQKSSSPMCDCSSTAERAVKAELPAANPEPHYSSKVNAVQDFRWDGWRRWTKSRM
jgi:fermentation-respiration switch protein FrsA (DUF1100 family)